MQAFILGGWVGGWMGELTLAMPARVGSLEEISVLLRHFQTTSHPQKGIECTQKGRGWVGG